MSSNVEIEVLTALRRLIRATDLDSKKLARQTQLSTSQLLLLELLAAEGKLTVGRIAEKIGLAQATVTSVIDRLEQQGLVARNRNSEDRRQVNVRLTGTGKALVERAPTVLQTKFLRNFATLQDWEKSAILSSLQRLADLMDAEDLDASPVLDVGKID